MTRSTFIPIDGVDVVVLSHGGAEVRVSREAPFVTDDRRLAAKLSEHRSVELASVEELEAEADPELEVEVEEREEDGGAETGGADDDDTGGAEG